MKREDTQESRCKVCGSTDTVTDEDNGEVVCARCGYLITDRLINRGVEYYTKDMEQKLKKQHIASGRKPFDHTVGPKTLIGKSHLDIYNTCTDPNTIDTMLRLDRLNKKIAPRHKNERTYAFLESRLHILRDRLHLNDTAIKRVNQLYIKAGQHAALYGRRRDARLAAVTYIVCREANISRGFNEIANAFNVDPKHMWSAYMRIMEALHITLPAIDSRSYLNRLANTLTLDVRTARKALEIFNIVYERHLTDGFPPMHVAAAVIYTACKITGKRLGQADIAEATGISDVTIRNVYHRFRPIVREWLEKSKDGEGQPPG